MKGKNLLFVFADQWRRSATGFSGEEPVITPHMDAFARRSVEMTNAVSASPLCSPARASLLTGKYPLSLGMFTNCKTGYDIALDENEVAISDVLSDKGYQTGYIGKWHLDEPDLNSSDTPVSGAKNWDAFTPPGPRRHGFDFWYAYNAWDQHRKPHYWKDTPEKIVVEEWSPTHETDVALDFLDSRDTEKPFALYMSWNPPHSPYDTAPQQYKDKYPLEDIALKENAIPGEIMHHTFEEDPRNETELKELYRDYYAAITGLDDQFGRLIEYLENHDLLKDTYVVLTADHGDMLGSHGLIGKHVWYEESIGVPCLIGGGGLPAHKNPTVFASQDFAPTLLSLMGYPVADTMEGTDYSHALEHKEFRQEGLAYITASPGRDVFLEAFAAAKKNPADFGWRAVRTPEHTYVIEVGYNTTPVLVRYLYNLTEDPLQRNGIILENPQENPTAMALEENLVAWLTQQDDGFLQHLK